jgi:hypothetical protein
MSRRLRWRRPPARPVINRWRMESTLGSPVRACHQPARRCLQRPISVPLLIWAPQRIPCRVRLHSLRWGCRQHLLRRFSRHRRLQGSDGRRFRRDKSKLRAESIKWAVFCPPTVLRRNRRPARCSSQLPPPHPSGSRVGCVEISDSEVIPQTPAGLFGGRSWGDRLVSPSRIEG